MSKIGIRCDCGPVMGMGHISRQNLIYEELIKLGHEVFFFVKRERDIVKSLGLPLSKKIMIDTMDILIIDLVEDFENYDFPRTKIIFYDGPEILKCNADIVFALNYKQQKSWYKDRGYFVGLDYIPMDSNISNIKKEYGNLKKILIMTSGFDPWDMPRQILNSIKDLEYEITVKLSSAYPKKWIENLERDAKVLFNVKSVSSLYEKYDLMICTAGNVLFEAAAAGLPCISFSAGKVQEGHGTFLSEKCFSIHLGGFWNNTAEIGYLSDAIKFMSDIKERKERGEMGRSLCDGKGLERIINIIG